MRTAVTSTSIDSYRNHRNSGKKDAQRLQIIRFIEVHGGDWSIGELAQAMNMDKSTVSARLNEALYETHELVKRPHRKDRVSNIKVRPVALPTQQMEMFQ